MPLRLVLLGLLAALAIPAASAQSDGILVVRPVPSLSFDPGFGPRPADAALASEPARFAAGPRERGAWRGAKRGFLIGAAIGVVATAATFAIADRGAVACDYFCGWHLAAAASVAFTGLTTATGVVVGAARAADPVPLRTP